MIANISAIYNSIVSTLKKHANSEVAERDTVYFKKEGYKSYGLRTPQVKEIFKTLKNTTKNLNKEDTEMLVSMLYKSGVSEEASVANSILNQHIFEIYPSDFQTISNHADFFNNWGTVDDFCLKILQPLLITYPKDTLEMLKTWNKSENMWKRRASVVTFVRKVGEGGIYTKEVISLCSNLLLDSEDLVLKGVGWSLKDNMRGNKNLIQNYIVGLRSQGISAVITSYALRDLSPSEKKKFLSIKKLS